MRGINITTSTLLINSSIFYHLKVRVFNVKRVQHVAIRADCEFLFFSEDCLRTEQFVNAVSWRKQQRADH